ncbi:MAG TPA: mannose-1-phosphate guanylyltransferase [Draconibacterium sp.]|nr:mannose-1-phosphate guanylyltransferase [Draconibacterium sp.]
MNNTFCVIMAGGIGSRFWPLSRIAKPKQFLDILGTGKTCLQQTYERFLKLVPKENFVVVTNVSYKKFVLEQLPDIKEDQVLLEPLRRNTAPCLAYALQKIKLKSSKAKLIVTPSDHLILDGEEFIQQLQNGLDFLDSNEALITLGIKPDRPETMYGYIQIQNRKEFHGLDNLYKVKTFTEKPDVEMAKIFIETGEFYWNSGIFISTLSCFLDSFDKYLPDIAQSFANSERFLNTGSEEAFIKKTYSECQAISIDYGIMEKAKNVFVLTVEFGWTDLGSWSSLYEKMDKDKHENVVRGNNALIFDSNHCIVDISDHKAAVIQGLDGYIIAESNDVLMICRREDEDQIKKFVTDVRIKKGDSLV